MAAVPQGYYDYQNLENWLSDDMYTTRTSLARSSALQMSASVSMILIQQPLLIMGTNRETLEMRVLVAPKLLQHRKPFWRQSVVTKIILF